MIGLRVFYLGLAALLLLTCAENANAQTTGYAEALGQLATSCGLPQIARKSYPENQIQR